MAQLFANNISTTLASSCIAGDTSLSVASTAGFPTMATVDWFYLTLATATVPETAWEVVKVTAWTGTTLTVVRGQDGTTAAGWASATRVEMRMPAQGLRDMAYVLVGPEVSFTYAGTAAINAWNKCTAASANYALTLPAVASYAGRCLGVRIAPSSTYIVTVTGNAAEQIDGSNTRVMWAGESAILFCDGYAWYKVSGKTIPMSGCLGVSGNQTFASSTMTAYGFTYSANLTGPTAFQTSASSKFTVVRPGRHKISLLGLANNTNTTANIINMVIYKNTSTAVMGNYAYVPASSLMSDCAILEDAYVIGDYFTPSVVYTAGSYATSVLYNDYGVASNNRFTVLEIPSW